MRRRGNMIGLVATAVATALPLIPPQARAQTPIHAAARHAGAHKYVNPFTDPDWSPARTDMGVDWIPQRRLPVLAIGDALILGSDSHSGWPGGRIIWYRLL